MSRAMKKKVVLLPYDMDTGIGTNNEGDLVFGYSLEDTDHLSGQTINLVEDGMCVDGEEYTQAGESVANAEACRTGLLSVSGNTEYEVSDQSESATGINIYLEGGGNKDYLTTSDHATSFTAPSWAETAVITFYGVHNPASFIVSTTTTGADVFNGQKSVLWNNLRDMFPEELAEMYKSLRSSGKLSFEKTEEMFSSHQAKWPEAIFNEDSLYKYIEPLRESGDKTYLPMLQGSKAAQRKWWLYNRFRYMDSKYNAGDALSDYIQLRGYAKGDITITPYADIYPSIKYGSYLVQTRGERNQSYTIACPLDQMNDTEIYIYSASALVSIGDISALKVGLADFSRATKLQEIKLGDSAPGYSNPNLYSLSFGRNTLLRKVDARNCVGLGQAHQGGTQRDVNLSLCTGLEEAYFDGTNVAAVYLPNGGSVQKLHLPGTIANLTLRNLSNLTEFVCPDFTHITTLWLDNPTEVVDTQKIVEDMPVGGRIRLFNFHWEMDGLEDVITMFDKLDTMRGMDQNGDLTSMDQAVYGTIHAVTATEVQINNIRNRYPDVTVTYDILLPTLIYMSEDGTTVLKREPVEVGGNGTQSLPPDKENTTQYTYISLGWSRSVGGEVDPDALNNIQTDRTVYAVYASLLQSYDITFKRGPEDGNDILKTIAVNYGEMPDYGTVTPLSNRGTTYAFYGWSPELATVTGPAEYTAVFYAPVVLSYYDYDGTLLYEENVAYGGSGRWNTTITRESTPQFDYTFTGWSATQGGSASNSSRQNITSNKSVYAAYSQSIRSYTITFVRESVDGGGTLQTKVVNYGTIPTYTEETPTTTQIGDYEFDGWNPAIAAVTGTQTYTAVFRDLADVVVKYLKRSLTDYESTTATTIGRSAFYQMYSLTSVKTTADTINEYAYQSCKNIKTVDLINPTEKITIGSYAFYDIDKMESMFIRSSQVATLGSSSIPMHMAVGYNKAIYVHDNLVADYKIADGWANYSNAIHPISEYPITNFDTINDDWSTIVTKVNNGTADYKLGDTKSIDFGADGVAYMCIVGIDKDELSDNSGGTAKYTWIAKYLPNITHRMNPALSGTTEGTGAIGGWEHCEMRSYLQNTLWNMLPNELTANGVIKEVKKYSRIYNTSGTAENDVITNDRIWIPSAREINTTDANAETQGVIYNEYYTSSYRRYVLRADNSSNTWLRTAQSTSGFRNCFSGNVNTSASSSTPIYICFGFCI